MATVSTNVGKPKKKKKGKGSDAAPVSVPVTTFKVERTGEPQVKVERGTTKKTYTPARTFTGHKEYGKENPKNKDAAFIEKAREKKQDIAYDKDNKPYRAGHTTEVTTPPKVSVVIPKPKFSTVTTNKVVKPKKSTEEIRSQSGPAPTRKLKRVKYLRNKDAKGGISNERGRKASESGY